MPITLVTEPDGVPRCSWCVAHPAYRAYHDEEWGRPVHDDQALFRKLCLDGFQAGLSWWSILSRRDAFRDAFADFDPAVLVTWGADEVDRLVADPRIIRHRGKIEATLRNARIALDLADRHGSLDAWLWRFAPDPASRPARITPEVASRLVDSPESHAMAKALKQEGWGFVGPTIAYAFMQAVGMVDDHLEGCHARGAGAA